MFFKIAVSPTIYIWLTWLDPMLLILRHSSCDYGDGIEMVIMGTSNRSTRSISHIGFSTANVSV